MRGGGKLYTATFPSYVIHNSRRRSTFGEDSHVNLRVKKIDVLSVKTLLISSSPLHHSKGRLAFKWVNMAFPLPSSGDCDLPLPQVSIHSLPGPDVWPDQLTS